MQLTDAVRSRRMIRTYDQNRAVPREMLEAMLSLAVRAPSAGHTQGWHFLVLDDITSGAAFWDATSDAHADTWLDRMRTAPVLIVIFSDKDAYLDRYAEPDKGWSDRAESRWPMPYWDIDAGMAAMILLLAAVDAGLGACFFGVPSERWDALRAAFAVPAGLRPVGVVSLGYPAPDIRSPSLKRGRRPLEEVISYGSFGSG
ncbi:MAG: nitroreductase family protein [Pseudonocardiales bacterium]|nr:nitroreductase family protein [Actinomycetota bacterium]